MTVKANAAILFADIAGSMRLYQGLGDERASVVVARCIHTMSDMVRASAGTVVRVVGDEVLATFPHADAAADAAIAIQAAISNMPPELGRPLGIRVGMHFGEILQDGPELYGDAVNVAARMVGQAKAGEILLTGSTAATLKGQAADMARTLGPIDIKGHTEAIEICEIVWKSEEATMMFRAPSASAMERRPVMPRVAFEHAGGRTVMTDHRSTLTFGREQRNDVVIMGAKVSRQHAFVECRNGRVVLVDQSANGTYVVPHGGTGFHLHRDSVVLTGAGRIGLGEEPQDNALVTIRYETAAETADAGALGPTDT
jgi:class 3 adenylate cyclase